MVNTFLERNHDKGQTPEHYASESMKNTETFMQEFWDDMGVGFNGTTGQIVDNFDELSMHMSGANHNWVQTANHHEFDSTTMRHEQVQNRVARWQSEVSKSTGASFSETKRFSMFNEARKEAIKDGLYHSPFLHGESPKPEVKPEPTFMEKTSTRLWGAVQAVQGIAEMAIAAGVEIETAGLATALVAAAGAHGADDTWTGIKTMWTGVPQATSTAKATYAMTGSEGFATGMDVGLGLFGLAGVSKISSVALAYPEQAVMGKAILGGASGFYGAMSSGGSALDIATGTGVGAGLSYFANGQGVAGTLLQNPYIYSGAANAFGQLSSAIYSPEDFSFNLRGLGAAIVAPYFSQGRLLTMLEEFNPVTRTSVAAMIEAPINAIGSYRGRP